MAEVEGEPVATRKCDVCEKQIEVPKFRLHEVACARQNYKCRKCGEVVAKAERDKYEKRCKAMDNWLMQKKIEEAHKVANLRELERREEIEKQLRDEKQTNSYKEWMRLQSMKQRQTRKYNKRKQQTKDSVLARQMAEHEAMQQQRLQQIRDADGMYEHHDEMDMAGDEDDEDEMDDGIDAYEAMEEMDGMP